jgi:hypothetical protein
MSSIAHVKSDVVTAGLNPVDVLGQDDNDPLAGSHRKSGFIDVWHRVLVFRVFQAHAAARH